MSSRDDRADRVTGESGRTAAQEGRARTSVGMIGVGAMGGSMARRLLEGGLDVHVFDADEQRAHELDEAGAVVERHIADFAASCATVCVTVVDDDQTRAVVMALLGNKPLPDCIILHSTLDPDTPRALGEAARAKGIALLDAPVTGGPERAAIGSLTVLVGGASADLDAERSVLSGCCSSILHVGDLGAGQVAKIANNLMSIVNTVAVAEALALAAAHGLTQEDVLQAASLGSGASNAVSTWSWRHQVVEPGGDSSLRAMAGKDLRLAVDLARRADVNLPLTAAAERLLATLDEAAIPPRETRRSGPGGQHIDMPPLTDSV